MDTKTRPIYMLSKRKPLQTSRNILTESERMEKYIPCEWKAKESGVAILISDKIDPKIKKITRDKEGHYIMIEGSIQEEDRTIINIYAPNIGAPQYIRQTLTDIKGEIDSNTIGAGDFNTPLTPMGRSSKQRINKETETLNETLDQMDLVAILRTFHPNAEEYTFSQGHLNILQDRLHVGPQIKPQ